jgi:hypothetical protein
MEDVYYSASSSSCVINKEMLKSDRPKYKNIESLLIFSNEVGRKQAR